MFHDNPTAVVVAAAAVLTPLLVFLVGAAVARYADWVHLSARNRRIATAILAGLIAALVAPLWIGDPPGLTEAVLAALGVVFLFVSLLPPTPVDRSRALTRSERQELLRDGGES